MDCTTYQMYLKKVVIYTYIYLCFVAPAKCSLDEIERKRLEALAKREAKRQQEFIERKRQEALKKLEIRRKKNATMVKSSLTNRLN